jgi:hypothetical protein
MKRRGPSYRRPFSPRGRWSQVDPRATQAALRKAFARRGLPERLRVDNGAPWGSRGDLPTDLVCWLAGLGVAVTDNPPRRPQANGVVERFQGVGKMWAEPDRCRTIRELQRRLDELDRWQRELYPVVDVRGRLEAYPGLRHSGRAYDSAWEAAHWDLQRVWDLMASYLVPRRVDSQGKVSVYNRPHSVGPIWSGRTIWVGFDPVQGSWVFQDERGHEIRRQAATELEAASIRALRVTNRRQGVHAAKPTVGTNAAKPTVR